MRAQITERLDEERILLKIESVEGDISRTWKVGLAEQSPESTKVTLTADKTARGSFEWVMNQIIRSQLGKMVSKFVDCISKVA